ncbi:MAG: hypothetical protein GY807_01935, partial [Gammaproteobacteria bacterium]|nr:hypothetical protein [Gammaproteobacteria bacterium]
REEWLTNRDLVETKSLERGRPLPPDRLDYYATERTILAGYPPAHVMPAMEQAAKERHKEPTPYAFETLERVLGATRRQLDAKGLDPKLPGGMDKATYEQSLERALQDTKERCIEKGYSLRPDTLDRYAAELMFSRGHTADDIKGALEQRNDVQHRHADPSEYAQNIVEKAAPAPLPSPSQDRGMDIDR